MDDLIAFPLVAALFGALFFSIGLYMSYSRRKRPPFWLAPLSGLATGIFMFIGFAGNGIIKHDFWTGDGNTSPTGRDMLPWIFGVFGLIGLFVGGRDCHISGHPKMMRPRMFRAKAARNAKAIADFPLAHARGSAQIEGARKNAFVRFDIRCSAWLNPLRRV